MITWSKSVCVCLCVCVCESERERTGNNMICLVMPLPEGPNSCPSHLNLCPFIPSNWVTVNFIICGKQLYVRPDQKAVRPKTLSSARNNFVFVRVQVQFEVKVLFMR